ncbi:hypothetical protein [Leucobacter luti]|uniref:hypothetical protein n=1 Tax=Leucobacter luti TaxID=340320 RepID=UPI003CFE538E
MLNPELNFFSFIRLTDPSERAAYNEWHQLDHLPENRALPGVMWGDRWALTEDCRAVARGEGNLAGADFVAMYWFLPPVEQAVAEWTQLGEDSFQWGRGPMLPGIRREMLAFFAPVKGYAAVDAPVSPRVLPLRPHAGVHVEVTHFDDPHAVETHDAHRRQDREVIPRLIQEPGVVGAWTFAFSHPQRHATLPFPETGDYRQGSVRIRLTYLDGDPVEGAARIDAVEASIPGGGAGTTLFSGPLRTIVPWRDW